MRLLVSVRSAAEAAAAVAGGADVIDAKEPARGSLGAVDADTLAAILRSVPARHPVSVALGDFTRPEQARAVVASLPILERPGATFIKLGFAGAGADADAGVRTSTRGPALERISAVLAAAVRAAQDLPSRPGVIAVAYADAGRVDAPAPQRVREAARDSGARGVLLDTAMKDGATLLDLLTLREIGDWVTAARADGLLTALAGSLDAYALEPILGLGAEIAGVRGAACDGGRNGSVSRHRVAALARRLGLAKCQTPRARPSRGVVPSPPPETT